jgi:hypothetical protein
LIFLFQIFLISGLRESLYKGLLAVYTFVRHDWLPLVRFFWRERQYYLSVYLFLVVLWIGLVVFVTFTITIPFAFVIIYRRNDFSFFKRWF